MFIQLTELSYAGPETSRVWVNLQQIQTIRTEMFRHSVDGALVEFMCGAINLTGDHLIVKETPEQIFSLIETGAFDEAISG